MTDVIYCAAGNRRFAEIAIQHGLKYGAQLPNTVYFPPHFTDQNWKNPDRAAYMRALAQHKPALATVLDWERDDQLDEVLSWAQEAAGYVTEAVIIIPKVMGGIDRLPREIGSKQVRLGYSVPTKFGATSVPQWEFVGWPVHLLGGSPQRQLTLAHYLNVSSADGNYTAKMALAFSNFFIPTKCSWSTHGRWPHPSRRAGAAISHDAPYHAFRLSCINVANAWRGLRYAIAYGVPRDVDEINRIARQWDAELGFVRKASLLEAMGKFEVFVAFSQERLIGFVNWHRRRDGWSTVYEIGVDREWLGCGVGAALLNAVPKPVRLKCTVDNDRANRFYERMGMHMVRVETGRKRKLNVWETLP